MWPGPPSGVPGRTMTPRRPRPSTISASSRSPTSIQEKFVAAYKAAGGAVDYHVFEGSEHQWVAQPGPQTDKARAMVKAFIARQLKTRP